MPALVVLLALVLVAVYFKSRGAPSTAPQGPQAPAAPPYGPPAPTPRPFSPSDAMIMIEEIADEEDYLRPELARAIAAVESGLHADAINTSDRPPSVGLMGLKVPTARHYVAWVDTEADLFDPATNIRAGIRFLKDLELKHLSSYGLDGVIQMYNLGETRFLAGERSADYLARVKARL